MRITPSAPSSAGAGEPIALPAILDLLEPGILILDAQDLVLAPASRSAAALLHCSDPVGERFGELLKPLASERTLALILGARGDGQVLPEVPMRLPGRGDASVSAYYRFEFHTLGTGNDRGRCLVVISDTTGPTQTAREVADLKRELHAQQRVLRGVLRMGRNRFSLSLQKTETAMSRIDAILKKPAREQAAFRRKLEETIEQVDRIRREGAALQFDSLEGAARSFEDALHDLRGRASLSGSDFLPLAIKLDGLYGEFALLRSVTQNALPKANTDQAHPITNSGTQVIDAPQFIEKMRLATAGAGVAKTRAAGSLESTLANLSALIAEEYSKEVALECSGLDAVPGVYQTTVKNVAIQLIRNAIMHGIESAGTRARAAKPALAALRLAFQPLADGSFEFRFQDDGRGIDPQRVRRTAVAKDLIPAQDAQAMPDRQVIKLIFKAGFTTLRPGRGDIAHGGGLTLVRRYVEESGGKIALASDVGRGTRFKISLPALIV